MKISAASPNNHRKTFDLMIGGKRLSFPYGKAAPLPGTDDPVTSVVIDPELGNEGIEYTLASGATGTVLADQVLDYNSDPAYVRDALLYNLTLQAQRRVAASKLSKREIIRRLHTSASQFYRLTDQTNYAKSIDQMILLLQVLECDVQVIVTARSA